MNHASDLAALRYINFDRNRLATPGYDLGDSIPASLGRDVSDHNPGTF
jgi:hypothetical protein